MAILGGIDVKLVCAIAVLTPLRGKFPALAHVAHDSMLWKNGNEEAALRLEVGYSAFWQSLVGDVPFVVFGPICKYWYMTCQILHKILA